MLSIGVGAGAHDRTFRAYGSARAVFRDPVPPPDGRYVAILGGSATYGKAVDRPYPALLQAVTTARVVNLGVLNGGPDAYLSDPGVLNVIARAEMAVVQLTGAEALSNPFYSVHARRNDRFLAARPALRGLFPEVDFTEIHFTRHLLQVLSGADADRFARVVQGLKANWIARMQDLLVHLPLRRRLLWLADSAPPEQADRLDGLAPLLVDSAMLARLRPLAGAVIPALSGPEAQNQDRASGFPVAGVLPGPAAHREIAAALAPEIRAELRRGRPSPLILRQSDAIR